jgi:hypothetical protein
MAPVTVACGAAHADVIHNCNAIRQTTAAATMITERENDGSASPQVYLPTAADQGNG